MKTRAAVAVEPGRSPELLDLDLAPVGSGEVLVRNLVSGVCQTDLHSMSGAEPWRQFPFVPGHEGVALVEEVGADVRTLRPGDRVIPLYKSECGTCAACTNGRNNCDTVMPTQKRGVLLDGTSRLSYRGEPVLHYMGCSTFSEYGVAPEISLARVESGLPDEQLCLFGCAITTGLGAVHKVAAVRSGHSVAVFGVGGVGAAAILAARIAGVEQLIAVDPNAERRRLASSLGADLVLDPGASEKPVHEEIAERTGGGVDHAFEAAGRSTAVHSAILAAHAGSGTCTLLGNLPASEELSFHPGLVLGGRRIQGCTFGGVMGRSELPDYVRRFEAAGLSLEPLISHRLPLERIEEALGHLRQGAGIRTVLTLGSREEDA